MRGIYGQKRPLFLRYKVLGISLDSYWPGNGKIRGGVEESHGEEERRGERAKERVSERKGGIERKR